MRKAMKSFCIVFTLATAACGGSPGEKSNLLNRSGSKGANGAVVKLSSLRKQYSRLTLECGSSITADTAQSAKATKTKAVWDIRNSFSPRKSVEYSAVHNGIRSSLKMNVQVLGDEKDQIKLRVLAGKHKVNLPDPKSEAEAQPSELDRLGEVSVTAIDLKENTSTLVLSRIYKTLEDKTVSEQIFCSLESEKQSNE